MSAPRRDSGLTGAFDSVEDLLAGAIAARRAAENARLGFVTFAIPRDRALPLGASWRVARTFGRIAGELAILEHELLSVLQHKNDR